MMWELGLGVLFYYLGLVCQGLEVWVVSIWDEAISEERIELVLVELNWKVYLQNNQISDAKEKL